MTKTEFDTWFEVFKASITGTATREDFESAAGRATIVADDALEVIKLRKGEVKPDPKPDTRPLPRPVPTVPTP